VVRIASSGIKQKRRKRLLIIAGIIFGILVVLFLLSLWFSNTAWLKIASVSVSGENVVPASSIEAVVTDNISGRYFGMFSRANIFFYPKDKIENDLHTLYPTLGDTNIHALDLHTLSVTVVERTPYALWCGNGAATSSGGCVLLDEKGLAYAYAPEFSGHVYEMYIGALPEGPLPKQFLTPTSFHSLSALVETFSKKIAPDVIVKVVIDENNDVHLVSSGGYEIKFSLADETGAVFQRFTLTLTADPFTTHPLSDFEYIDLRFGDKVYYKLKS